MTLGKTTIANSVKYIAQSEQTKNRDNKPNTVKNISLPKNQNKSFSRNNKNFIQDYITAQKFRIFKEKMNCYFNLKTYRSVN